MWRRWKHLGVRRGRASAVCFHHPTRRLLGLVHGDDFVFSGFEEDLNWVAAELSRAAILNAVGKMGKDTAAGDIKEAKCLNRISRWTPDGYMIEADPRHAELLAAMLGPKATPLSTPGVREPGQARERLGECEPGAGLASAGDGTRESGEEALSPT